MSFMVVVSMPSAVARMTSATVPLMSRSIAVLPAMR